MAQEMLPTGSALALAEYVKNVDVENQRMIDQSLLSIAREIDGNQRLIHHALVNYRAGLKDDLSDDEFYDFVAFINVFTVDFNENRIDLSILKDEQLTAWIRRSDAPKRSVRRNVMILLMDTALEQGLLGGVGRVNEWLSFAGDSSLPGTWLLVEQDQK